MQHQTIVITGASAGVGRAAAHAFVRHGARVALLARGLDGLEATRQEIEQAGGQALVIPTDVADPDQVEAAALQVEKDLGPIDVWVNNAMTTVFSPLSEITPAEFRRATEVTYLGVVWGTMTALRHMMKRNHGVIVQVGSALAYRAIPLQSPYCGAKHAIRGFTDALRSELLHDHSKIRVTMVQLPALNTPQFEWSRARLPNAPQPVPPIFQPEVAARAIVWASTHHRREVYVGRSTTMTIWLNKLFPGLGDRFLARHGYEDQQTDQPLSPQRESNLFEPVAGDHGTHGPFDARATDQSWQWWMTTHRVWIGAAVAAALFIIILVAL